MSSSSSPCHRLQLTLRARRLPKAARRSLRKPSPFAVVLNLGGHPDLIDAASPPRLLGRTEVISDDADPSWTTVFIADDFTFGAPRYVEVGVFDYTRRGPSGSGAADGSDEGGVVGATVDRNDLRLSRSDGGDDAILRSSFAQEAEALRGGGGGHRRRASPLKSLRAEGHACLGTAVFELGDILGTRGSVRCKALRPLNNGDSASSGGSSSSAGGGVLYAQITRSPLTLLGSTIYFQIRALRLKNTQSDLLNRRSSPFFEIYRREDGPQGARYNNIYRSSTVRESLNPLWDAVEMDLDKFCVGGDGDGGGNNYSDRSMKVILWDRRRNGRHKRMGEFETSVGRFVAAKGRTRSDLERAFALTKDGKRVGSVVVVEATITTLPSESERSKGAALALPGAAAEDECDERNAPSASVGERPATAASSSVGENEPSSHEGVAAAAAAMRALHSSPSGRRRMFQSEGRDDAGGRALGAVSGGVCGASSEHSSSSSDNSRSSSSRSANADERTHTATEEEPVPLRRSLAKASAAAVYRFPTQEQSSPTMRQRHEANAVAEPRPLRLSLAKASAAAVYRFPTREESSPAVQKRHEDDSSAHSCHYTSNVKDEGVNAVAEQMPRMSLAGASAAAVYHFPVHEEESAPPATRQHQPHPPPRPTLLTPAREQPRHRHHHTPRRRRRRRPEFVDYLAGGCDISLSVAIDFTSSNGSPRVPGNPHFVSPAEDPSSSSRSRSLNDYESAIFSVGSILSKYADVDDDAAFPVMRGFGAKIDGRVNHCFRLACGDEEQRGEEVPRGVEGMLETYRGMFRRALVMSHPTVFVEVIGAAAADAAERLASARLEHRLSYSVLLILTAGNVSDVAATQRALAEAGAAPLSVVIVGIGDAEFRGMRFLDEFGERPPATVTVAHRDGGMGDGIGGPGGSRNVGGGFSRGVEAEPPPVRDITQFVKFNDYRPKRVENAGGTMAEGDTSELAEAVLEEIPDQLVEYFLERGLLPPGAETPPCGAASADGLDDEGSIPVQPPDRAPSRFFR